MSITDQQAERAISYARDLGTEHGKAAASWYFDGNTPAETYPRILKGIEDGDPETLDTFPHPDLSGQWADSLTGPDLVRDAIADATGIYDDSADAWTDDPFSILFSDICDAYELAFDTAAQDEIERMARYQVEP